MLKGFKEITELPTISKNENSKLYLIRIPIDVSEFMICK